jgi:hypothetical protein
MKLDFELSMDCSYLDHQLDLAETRETAGPDGVMREFNLDG